MGEYAASEGSLDATGMRFAIVIARFNQDITEELLDGAQRILEKQGAADVRVLWVPGAFEAPLVAKRLAASGTVDAVICLGAVIRGETAHFEYVAGETVAGITRAALDTGIPVIFGVLTVDDREQARDRLGGKEGHKGEEAALTAIEMASLLRDLPVTSPARYDTIGRTYASARRADPHIAAQIAAALGDASRVVNVGCGTGNYEPEDRFVAAIDPSITMLRQRRAGAAAAVMARAETLPFANDTFDAALAILTVHHWDDIERGLREMQRVARRQVVFSFETSMSTEFWLVADYFPEIVDLPTERTFPDTERLSGVLSVRRVEHVVVPADCQDGFAGCYWNRPEAYLDPIVQEGMSCFAQLDPDIRRRGTERLRADLESGVWDDRHGYLRELTEIDMGYRLLVADNHLS